MVATAAATRPAAQPERSAPISQVLLSHRANGGEQTVSEHGALDVRHSLAALPREMIQLDEVWQLLQ